MDKIRVICPNCGKLLKVNNDPAFKNKKMKCPTCGVSSPFISFKAYALSERTVEEEKTQIAGLQDDTSGYFIDEKTSLKYVIPDGKKSLFGRLSLQGVSPADVPIDLRYPEGLDKGVSRSHFWIHSILSSDGRYHIYISNAKNVNRTYINGSVLDEGDEVGLNNGDIVSCSNMVLRFVKPVKLAPASSLQDRKGDDEDKTML